MYIEIILIFLFNLILYLNHEKLIKFYGIYDAPDKERKIHEHETSLLGGFIFFINIFLFSLIIFFSDNSQYDLLVIFNNVQEYLLFILVAFSFYLLGFFDDKYDLNANFKFVIIILLIVFLIFFDENLKIKIINFTFSERTINLNTFSVLFSIFCFVAFINAFNLYDGINLQSGTYFLFILIFLTILTNFNFFIILFFFPLILFLILNSNGKIFLGNSGTYLLSYLIAYLFIKVFNLYETLYSDQILAIMLIPGLDMIRLFIIRISLKTSPFKSDRKHIHHIFLEYFSYKKTILFVFLLSILPLILLLIFKSYFVILFSIFLYFLIIFLLDKLISNFKY